MVQPRATVIGDIVASRAHPDRHRLHQHLTTVLTMVSQLVPSPDPARLTVGDEYQGSYATLGEAVEAAFLIHTLLQPDVDSRHGLGWGEVTRLDDTTQDGPGWWAAREAIEAVAAAQASRTPTIRTAIRAGISPPAAVSALDAMLWCRDALTASWDDRDWRIMQALIKGESQRQIAETEGVSESAISQRLRRSQAAMVLHARIAWRALA